MEPSSSRVSICLVSVWPKTRHPCCPPLAWSFLQPNHGGYSTIPYDRSKILRFLYIVAQFLLCCGRLTQCLSYLCKMLIWYKVSTNTAWVTLQLFVDCAAIHLPCFFFLKSGLNFDPENVRKHWKMNCFIPKINKGPLAAPKKTKHFLIFTAVFIWKQHLDWGRELWGPASGPWYLYILGYFTHF